MLLKNFLVTWKLQWLSFKWLNVFFKQETQLHIATFPALKSQLHFMSRAMSTVPAWTVPDNQLILLVLFRGLFNLTVSSNFYIKCILTSNTFSTGFTQVISLQFLTQDSWLMKFFLSSRLLRIFCHLLSSFFLRVISPSQHLEIHLFFPCPLNPNFSQWSFSFLHSHLVFLFILYFSNSVSQTLLLQPYFSVLMVMLSSSFLNVLQILPNVCLKTWSCLWFWLSSLIHSNSYLQCVDHCMHSSTGH